MAAKRNTKSIVKTTKSRLKAKSRKKIKIPHKSAVDQKIIFSAGDLCLAYVDLIGESRLKLILPFDNFGYVDMKTFSHNLLEVMQRDKLSLSELFKVDQMMCVKILSKSMNNRGKIYYNVTIDPNEINSIHNFTEVPNNACIQGFTESQEDHGCIINIGSKKSVGFLNSLNDRKYFGLFNIKNAQESSLRAVKVGMKTNSFISLCNLENMSIGQSLLIPGTLIESQVQSILSDRIIFSCKDLFIEVSSHNLLNPASDYRTGQLSKLIIIHCSSEKQTIKASEKKIYHEDFIYSTSKLQSKIGEKINVRLNSKNIYGNLSYTFSDNILYGQKNDLSAKTTSSDLCARILFHNKIDDVTKISTDSEGIKERYMTPYEAKVGDTLQCRVIKTDEKHALMQISKNIYGYLDRKMMQKPTDNLLKYSTLVCRVWSLDSLNGEIRICLTTKADILSCKHTLKYPSKDSMDFGSEYLAIILKVNMNSLLISLPANILGFVKVPSEDIYNSKYRIGSVIKVRSVNNNIDSNLLKFKISSQTIEKMDNLDCAAIVKKKNKKNLICLIDMSGVSKQAILSKYDLSDIQSWSLDLFSMINEGNKINCRVLPGQSTSKLLKLTARKSFIDSQCLIRPHKKVEHQVKSILIPACIVGISDKEVSVQLSDLSKITLPNIYKSKHHFVEPGSSCISSTCFLIKKETEYSFADRKIVKEYFKIDDAAIDYFRLKYQILDEQERNLIGSSVNCVVQDADNKKYIVKNDNSLAISQETPKIYNNLLVNALVIDHKDSLNVIVHDSNASKFIERATNEIKEGSNNLIGNDIECKIKFNCEGYSIGIGSLKECVIICIICMEKYNQFLMPNKPNLLVNSSIAVTIDSFIKQNIAMCSLTHMVEYRRKNYLLKQVRSGLEPQSKVKKCTSLPKSSKKIVTDRYFTSDLSKDKFQWNFNPDDAPNDSSPTVPNYIDSDLSKANDGPSDHIQEKDTEKTSSVSADTIAKFENAIQFNPDDVISWIKFAEMYHTTGNVSKSISILEQSLSKISTEKNKSRSILLKALINVEASVETYSDTEQLSKISNLITKVKKDNPALFFEVSFHAHQTLIKNQSVSNGLQIAAHIIQAIRPDNINQAYLKKIIRAIVASSANYFCRGGSELIDLCQTVSDRLSKNDALFIQGHVAISLMKTNNPKIAIQKFEDMCFRYKENINLLMDNIYPNYIISLAKYIVKNSLTSDDEEYLKFVAILKRLSILSDKESQNISYIKSSTLKMNNDLITSTIKTHLV
ncbi:MAG: Protein RRP5 [Marteilia pararefringens]